MTEIKGLRRGPQMMRLVDRQQIAVGVYSVRLIPDEPMPDVVPGTFLHLLPGGLHVLRRPLSIADADADDEGYTVIFRVVGQGTDKLSTEPIGAKVDVLGPLGHGFDVDAVQPGGRALLVGGGVGIPPLYLLGRRLVERDVQVQFRLGFRDKNDVFWADRFGQLGEVLVSTDDGSVGTKGTVAQIADTEEARLFVPNLVQACGPLPMLRWVKSALAPTVRTQLSLEERMACGVGACYACVVGDATDPDHQFRVCVDGPVLAAEEVLL
ncbi:dihydroorotate dehydrogenase electron transfer subunit [Cutibacterium sp. WCA-380-WT-3A]|uniref:Dihydroorotate dehydrogenase B (NAD(+)), electron transfer subunit n=1 Tax=Cutibacterium porci TaxID=2605781 RepID=A0A7K0J6R2_9ACTN|nr:dihydroorotate dehydrogenase electron transfer subunit [Cutibacterium porci]MSS45650.1 dihydroorotate dehydrogenase electron transfer subunit [Cutibacterium porci]